MPNLRFYLSKSADRYPGPTGKVLRREVQPPSLGRADTVVAVSADEFAAP
jgi:hypothetical protein